MRAITNMVIVVGAASLVIGIVSRLTMTPIAVVRGGLEAQAFLSFSNTCFLIAIILILSGAPKGK